MVLTLFRTVSEQFRTVSDRFETVSDRFRIVSAGRLAGRSPGRSAGRPGGARVVRGEKKNAGGPGAGSPPAKPVKGRSGWAEASPAKIRGPPSQNRKIFEKKKYNSNPDQIVTFRTW